MFLFIKLEYSSTRCATVICRFLLGLVVLHLSWNIEIVSGWIPFAEHALMGAQNQMAAHPGGGNPFGDPVGPVGGVSEFGGANPFSSFMPPYQSFRSSGSSIGSMHAEVGNYQPRLSCLWNPSEEGRFFSCVCVKADGGCYCDIRINKLGSPGELLFKLHYPTINAQNCQAAILQCSTSCRSQAQRQLTGNVLFEEGGLENVAPEKDVTVGTVLCREHSKVISPPGVIASVFAKPDACGRAAPIYDLTGEESRLCCTLIAHPYIRTEHILVFSPECIAGVAPPAPAGAAGAAAAGATPAPAAANANAVPAQAPEPVPYNQAPIPPMPQFRHYDPMNAMMLNAFG